MGWIDHPTLFVGTLWDIMGLLWGYHWDTIVYMTITVMPPNMAMLLGKNVADHRSWVYLILRQTHVQRGCFDRHTRRTVLIHSNYTQYVPIIDPNYVNLQHHF